MEGFKKERRGVIEHSVGRRVMKWRNTEGGRQRGRSKRRWLDRMRGDIKEKGLSGEEVYDRAMYIEAYIVKHRSHIKVD